MLGDVMCSVVFRVCVCMCSVFVRFPCVCVSALTLVAELVAAKAVGLLDTVKTKMMDSLYVRRHRRVNIPSVDSSREMRVGGMVR